jgi:hypothetical protein
VRVEVVADAFFACGCVMRRVGRIGVLLCRRKAAFGGPASEKGDKNNLAKAGKRCDELEPPLSAAMHFRSV